MRKRLSMVAVTSLVVLISGMLPVGAVGAAPPSGGPSGDTTLDGVTFQADGWIVYTKTLSQQIVLEHSNVRELAGKRTPDGGCTIGSAGGMSGAALTSEASFEETVAFNPTSCRSRVVRGDLDSAAAAQLDAISASSSTQEATASSSSAVPAAGTAGADSASGTATAAATSYQSSHIKTAWIDPVNITITSLAANLKWPLHGAAGTISWRWNSYAFPYDGWSTSAVGGGLSSVSGGWKYRATRKFTNSDFAAIVYALLGLAGWLACGAIFSTTAHFYHDVTTYGYSNGSRNRAWSDKTDGACSNLVHHAEWDGYGWTS